jgi:protein-S-isoprenylcysteine O-methyltransferase Ste14
VKFIAILVINLSISKYYRLRARMTGEAISRQQEGRLVMLMRVLYGIPILLSFLAYMINPMWMSWSKFTLFPWARWVGVGLGITCIPLSWLVFFSIGSNISETVLTKRNHEMVTSGPYHWVRHPLYSVSILLFVACSLIASNWWKMSFTAMALVLIVLVVIPREEEALVAKFEDAYMDYRKQVGKLLPRIRAFD